jgi:hypothetical protein
VTPVAYSLFDDAARVRLFRRAPEPPTVPEAIHA